MKIAIVDYGTGNLRSVGQAVKAVADGADVLVTQSSAEIDAADRVIFPGQGAMGDCMRCLGESGLKDAVLRALASKPVLAVCIGMQMLFERSDENDCAGLGLMAGKVIRFPEAALVRANGERLKVPQMGWNTVTQRMAHPLWNGNVSLGSEFTHSSRKNLYVNTEGILDNDNSRINENAVSAFLEYSRNFGPLQAQAGVRYEHLASGYYEQGRRIDEQSRTYDNVFPSVSLSMPVGKAQVQLAYSGSINRPSYYMLRSNVTYINRYTYESGNPMLKPTLMNRLTLNTSYKWISLNVNYTHLRDGLLYQSTQYSAENPTISMVTFVNTYDTDRLYATLTLAPTIGIWSPQFSAMLLKQWFPVDTPDGQENFGHPMGNFSWNNHFTLPKGFQLDIDLQADTRGDNENSRMLEGAWRADVSLYKSFLNERLSLQLQGSDLFESSQARITLFSGNRLMTLDQETRRQFRLTVRYKFNAAKNKYKGTGAGQSQKNRM